MKRVVTAITPRTSEVPKDREVKTVELSDERGSKKRAEPCKTWTEHRQADQFDKVGSGSQETAHQQRLLDYVKLTWTGATESTSPIRRVGHAEEQSAEAG